MNIDSLTRFWSKAPFAPQNRSPGCDAPVQLLQGVRVPYGAFRFVCELPQGTHYVVEACANLRTWQPILSGKAGASPVEIIDSQACNFSHRFYRVATETSLSMNVLGYAAVSVPPGHTMIANPFKSQLTIADYIKGWPDGTSVHRMDSGLMRLVENALTRGKWANPMERVLPGEGLIFNNPTTDYKAINFYGEVFQGKVSIPVPAGFSLRSCPLPRPGGLVEDLGFPISDGDVIHLFDPNEQEYVNHEFREGRWNPAEPVIGVGESFWVAKSEAGNWESSFDPAAPGETLINAA